MTHEGNNHITNDRPLPDDDNGAEHEDDYERDLRGPHDERSTETPEDETSQDDRGGERTVTLPEGTVIPDVGQE